MITSFKLAATLKSGQGSGTLELNHTALKFNDFGDFEAIGAHQSKSIPVQFRKFQPTRGKQLGDAATADDPQRSLYELTLQDGFFNLSLVVPKSTVQDCRLVVLRGGSVFNVIPLSRESRETANSKIVESKDAVSITDQIDLSSEYVLTEIGLRNFRIQEQWEAKQSSISIPTISALMRGAMWECLPRWVGSREVLICDCRMPWIRWARDANNSKSLPPDRDRLAIFLFPHHQTLMLAKKGIVKGPATRSTT